MNNPVYIENTTLGNIQKGNHFDCGPNSILIQIVDLGLDFPQTDYPFKEKHCFVFADVDSSDESLGGISDTQAETLVEILQGALANNQNVVVHCVAGLCRSGAVVEVGVMMGFTAIHNTRLPNVIVKRKMMKVLGWTYE